MSYEEYFNAVEKALLEELNKSWKVSKKQCHQYITENADVVKSCYYSPCSYPDTIQGLKLESAIGTAVWNLEMLY